LLGEKEIKRENGVWKSLDFTIQQMRTVMEEHGFEKVPSYTALRKIGRQDLTNAISRYHGGLPAFRAILAGKTPPSEKEQLTALVKKYAG